MKTLLFKPVGAPPRAGLRASRSGDSARTTRMTTLQALAKTSKSTAYIDSLQQKADQVRPAQSVHSLEAVQRIAAAGPVAHSGRTAYPAHQPVLQRTVADAAQELFDAGIKIIKTKEWKRKFWEAHGLTNADKAAVQTALDALRVGAPVAAAPVAPDMRVNTNWPTEGGMSEGDGEIVAGVLHYTEVKSDKFTCSDPSHTPKGKVYQKGGTYYGADKDGHVGWGFKVWVKKKGNMLDYKGNITWDGTAWTHDPRGTK